MAENRLEMLKDLAAQNPADSFVRYGLAMEYVRTGALEQAVAEFQALLAAKPSYAAAYYQAGQALEHLDRLDEARILYQQGVEATTRSGDLHARSELQAALDLLG